MSNISSPCSTEVLVTLTTDVGRILARLHQVQPGGDINFLTAIRVAHVRCSYPYFSFTIQLHFPLVTGCVLTTEWELN